MATRRKKTGTKKAPAEQPVAKTGGGALAEMNLVHADAGFEDTNADSYAIPFLKVLQSNSPEVNAADGAHIEEAKAGMLINSVTSELLEGCIFIQAAFQPRFIRWGPRDGDGGFMGEMSPEAAEREVSSGRVKNVDGRYYYPLADGTVNVDKSDRLVDTRNHFGLMIGEDEVPTSVVLSLSSTQIKKSRKLMAMLGGRRAIVEGVLKRQPTFSAALAITTVPESNEKGAWFGVNFALADEITFDEEGKPVGWKREVLTKLDPALIYYMALEFYQQVRGGAAKATYDEPDQQAGAPEGSADDRF